MRQKGRNAVRAVMLAAAMGGGRVSQAQAKADEAHENKMAEYALAAGRPELVSVFDCSEDLKLRASAEVHFRQEVVPLVPRVQEAWSSLPPRNGFYFEPKNGAEYGANSSTPQSFSTSRVGIVQTKARASKRAARRAARRAANAELRALLV